MPIYEYRCSSCGQQQEVMQKITDPLLTSCPKCGQPTLVKMLTAAGFQLKGSGWYATDFKGRGSSSPSKDSAAGGDKKAGEGGEKKGGEGGEKKAADSGGDSAKAPSTTPGAGTP